MDKVTLNNKEQKRLMVLNEVLAGRFTGQEAAKVLGLSLRQTRRLLATYRQAGAAGLAHGNRGRKPVNKIDPVVATQVVRLAGEAYLDYNDSHFREELAERHDITLSVPTVRRLRREAGLRSPRKRRAPRQRRLRQRYPQAGMLLQVDGSKHEWLEGRGPWLTLHAAIDDATNEVVLGDIPGGGRCHRLCPAGAPHQPEPRPAAGPVRRQAPHLPKPARVNAGRTTGGSGAAHSVWTAVT